jgi:hypothetical protein
MQNTQLASMPDQMDMHNTLLVRSDQISRQSIQLASIPDQIGSQNEWQVYRIR